MSTEWLIDDSEFQTPLYEDVVTVVRKFQEAQHRRDRRGRFTDTASVTVGGHQIAVVKPERAIRAGDQLVPVNVLAFDAAFQQDPGFYVGPGGHGGIGDRYARFGAFVAEHDSMDAAEVHVGSEGRVGFTNGRHRYAWLRDQGVTTIPVAMTPESVAHAKRHGLLAVVKLAWDESQHPRDKDGRFTGATGAMMQVSEGEGFTKKTHVVLRTPDGWKRIDNFSVSPSGKPMGTVGGDIDLSKMTVEQVFQERSGDEPQHIFDFAAMPEGSTVVAVQSGREYTKTKTTKWIGPEGTEVDYFHFDTDLLTFKIKKKADKQEHAYGNTQIQIAPTSSAAASLNTARNAIRDDHLMATGKDVDPNHVTVRFGLLNDDLDALRSFLAQQQPFEAQLGPIELFPASEHSDGAVPVVARIVSPELHVLEVEIGQHAAFTEKSFPDYKPHCTLAYCQPDKAELYAGLFVHGSFVVQSVTISHQSGVQETIPFGRTPSRSGVAVKADATGRYVTPFVSFDKQGDDQLRMIASLNSSRLATWGFTAEAEVRGMARYRLTAVLDGRTSQFCRLIDGKIFQLPDARRKVIEVLDVQNPEDLKVVQPWPKQTKAALAAFAQMSAAELTERGLHIPPFHPYCRTVCRVVQSSAGQLDEVIPTALPPEAETFQAVTAEDLQALGIEATPENVEQWNTHVGMSPVELLSKLSGLPPPEVMTKGKGVGAQPIQFDESGAIGFNVRGASPQGVEFKLGAILDPFTGTYYLSQADLLSGNPKAETAFLKGVFKALIDMGLKSTAESVAVNVAGNAAYYAMLGFLPDELEWDTLRTFALTEAEPLLASLAPEDRLLVEHLLHDKSVSAMSALVQLPFTYEGVTIGEWLFREASGTWALDLLDPELVAQAQAYLS